MNTATFSCPFNHVVLLVQYSQIQIYVKHAQIRFTDMAIETFGKSCVICLMLAPFGPMINRCSQRSTATSFITTLFAYMQHISIYTACIQHAMQMTGIGTENA